MAGYELNYEALDDEKEKKPSAAEEFIDWVETVICAFFVVILIFTFILRIANVDGGSMLPTLVEGDRLIVSHLMYTPEAGDIVIVNTEHPVRACDSCGLLVYDFEVPICPTCGKIDSLHVQKNEKDIVKRVIATENQTVDVGRLDDKTDNGPYSSGHCSGFSPDSLLQTILKGMSVTIIAGKSNIVF